jgi:surface polysaccharide O-acyltransferase-like enzyme
VSHTKAAKDMLRYLLEVSFSGTIASAFLIGLIYSSIYWSGQFFGWEMGLNHSFHRRLNDPLGQALAFYIWFLVLTVVLFLLLRALSRPSPTTRMLRTAAGIIVVATPSACYWFVAWCRPGYPHAGGDWLRWEGFFAVGCALLYTCNRWPMSARPTVTLLALHSALWIYAYWDTFLYSQWLTAPVTACLSTAIWGYHVKRRRQQQSAPRDTPAAGG